MRINSVKVSVIVPVYNSEKHLRQCINSILTQSLREIEVIFVDDGSTDKSVDIINEYKTEDSRIMLICQSNKYAGVARNTGFEHACGEYVIFLDSDDYFDSDLLKLTYKKAVKNNLEALFFGYFSYDSELKKITEKRLPDRIRKAKSKVFNPRDLGNRVFSFCYGVPWNMLIRKSFLDKTGIRYQGIKIHNDIYFSCMVKASADRMMCLYKHLVYYRTNQKDSIQGYANIYQVERIQCFIQSYTQLKNDLIKRNLFCDNIKQSFYYEIRNLFEFALMKCFASSDCCRNSREVFDMLKMSLNVLDIPAQIISENLLCCVLDKSNNYEEFMQNLVQAMATKLLNSVSKTSRSYIAGRFITYIPRQIRARLGLEKK